MDFDSFHASAISLNEALHLQTGDNSSLAGLEDPRSMSWVFWGVKFEP